MTNNPPESFLDAADIEIVVDPNFVPDVVNADPDPKDVKDLDEDASA